MIHKHPDLLPRLLRYDCGCVGFPINYEGKCATVVKICDATEGSPYGLTIRAIRQPELAAELSADENLAVWLRLDNLIGDGHAFKEVARTFDTLMRAAKEDE